MKDYDNVSLKLVGRVGAADSTKSSSEADRWQRGETVPPWDCCLLKLQASEKEMIYGKGFSFPALSLQRGRVSRAGPCLLDRLPMPAKRLSMSLTYPHPRSTSFTGKADSCL